jgi:hypothetical protein
MSEWQDKIQVKKGDLGEAIVDQYLKNKGFLPYRPAFDGWHPFDRILAAPDKSSIYVADVKAKARRNKYPDTGIDMRHFDKYKQISEKHNMRVFLFFVDELEGRIYGQFLDILASRDKNYPRAEGSIIYFLLEKMEHIAYLTPEQISQLKTLSRRNYDYNTATVCPVKH